MGLKRETAASPVPANVTEVASGLCCSQCTHLGLDNTYSLSWLSMILSTSTSVLSILERSLGLGALGAGAACCSGLSSSVPARVHCQGSSQLRSAWSQPCSMKGWLLRWSGHPASIHDPAASLHDPVGVLSFITELITACAHGIAEGSMQRLPTVTSSTFAASD